MTSLTPLLLRHQPRYYPVTNPATMTSLGTGDVISHIAASCDITYQGICASGQPSEKNVHVSLIHNPSHLEAANPVAVGKARGRQEDLEFGQNQALGDKVLCVQVHGDAAFPAQVRGFYELEGSMS